MGQLKQSVRLPEAMLARSAVLRVMVYDAKKADDGAERLCEHVGAFNGARGDTYLLIAFVGDISETRWFEFSEIIAQGPGNFYSKRYNRWMRDSNPLLP